MTTFNLGMELCQSPFYPKDRERDLLPLMEFKDCSMSDKESWEVSDSARYEVRKGMYIARWVLVCCLKGFLLHHSSATVTAFLQTFNRLTSEDVETVHQSSFRIRAAGAPAASDQTAIYGRWQFANISIWGKALGVTMRSAVKLEESAASIYFIRLFPMRCNCLTAWGYWWICHNTHKPILHKYVFLMKMYSKKDKGMAGK